MSIPVSGRGRIAAVILPFLLAASPSFSQGDVTITHYFTGELGKKSFDEQVAKFRGRNRLFRQGQPDRA